MLHLTNNKWLITNPEINFYHNNLHDNKIFMYFGCKFEKEIKL